VGLVGEEDFELGYFFEALEVNHVLC
jgi:hypothetical protein